MRIFRGPISKPFEDDSHTLVATIDPETIENAVATNSHITFNITKDSYARIAIASAEIGEDDLIPMLKGLITRLSLSQVCLAKITTLLNTPSLSDHLKLTAIRTALQERLATPEGQQATHQP